MKKLLVLFAIFCLIAPNSYALNPGSYDAGLLNSQYLKDIRTFESRKKLNKEMTPAIKTSQSLLSTVVYQGNVAFNDATLNLVIKDLIDQPLNSENIIKIRKALMKFYQDQGYFSAVVVVKGEDPSTGTLTLEIAEGGINSITIE